MNNSTYEDRLERNWKWCQEYFDRKSKQFKLEGWKIKLNGAKTSLGICYYNDKSIRISKHFLRGPTCTESKMRDTVLHEIAHALAGPKTGHGKKWKEMAKQIGCSAKTCATMDLPEAKYLMYCPNNCFQQTYYRKPNVNNRCCIKCRSTPILKTLR